MERRTGRRRERNRDARRDAREGEARIEAPRRGAERGSDAQLQSSGVCVSAGADACVEWGGSSGCHETRDGVTELLKPKTPIPWDPAPHPRSHGGSGCGGHDVQVAAA